ncbi:exo-beta-1,3-glucanase [Methylomonas sp. EFPC3]|uniref:glycoside hydrolase family 17 protein n=1 Tax=Methylomonas sp. EFPC3 TaxID=3021710 RepID=UPI002415A360|nr:exo-beta-1,3-glucanase [Methylomonas sp. EFPC3]WFP51568.1 exo-beta-1,3-glucanase [Methylomonas sp. EFPC3]
MSSLKVLLCLLLVFVAHGSIAWYRNQPQAAGPDVPSGKLRSLSFAPYHAGFSPIAQKFPLPEHIDTDARLIADKTYTIRTYSVRGGMQPTPEYARQHGLNMMMGAWLGDGHPENKVEIQSLIQAANQHPDVVTRVIVGNEVLLRKDMDIDTLIAYIRQVKQAVKQPVTYADVWSSYMQYPQLFQEVDFITVHILPYWEDEPVAIEHAADHVEKIVRQIEEKARSMGVDKPILIGESGWPSVGRQRGAAVPGVVNSARYIRDLIQVANRHGFDYNIVEAFNQPWKSHNEGVVGANWGLLDIDREPVFPLTGPVQENPDWLQQFGWAAALSLAAAGIGRRALQHLAWPKLTAYLLLIQVFSGCLVHLADLSWETSYSVWQQAYTLIMICGNAALAGLLLIQVYAAVVERAVPAPCRAALQTGYLLFMALAVAKTYLLAFDGRYLSFPVEQFTIPAVGIAALAVCRRLGDLTTNSGAEAGKYSGRLAFLLGLGIFGIVAGETYSFMSAYDFIQAHPSIGEGLPVALGYTLQNRQLLAWLVCILILALPYWPKPSGKPQPAGDARISGEPQ